MPEHRHRGRVVGAALGAALAAGLVTGLTARLLMRALSLLIGVESGEFSAAGTAMIVFVFTVLAVPAAATAVARPAIRRAGRDRRARGRSGGRPLTAA